MRKLWKVVMCLLVASASLELSCLPVLANEQKIAGVSATAKSSNGHNPQDAIDGSMDTYWQSPDKSTMEDHYRSIDFDLGGVYDLSEIKIYNNPGSYYNYQIYGSETGETYSKIAYKSNEVVASKEGDSYPLTSEKAKNVSKVRVNISFNSAKFEGNVAEIEFYGIKIKDKAEAKPAIKVDDFKDSKWSSEYAKVESDDAYAKDKTLKEMSSMVQRVLGDAWTNAFTFAYLEDTGKDHFEVSDGANGITIRGNNGISMASGFNYYLKNYAHVNYNPIFASNINMPETLPAVGNTVVKETEYDVRYALNFCTYSYTMAFWSWEEYEAFLDWAAMNGVNLMLDIIGQEEVIRRTFNEFGYSDEEVKDYISGPAFFAWYYMQNMTSHGGPLPDNWFDNRVELGRKMHDRMQTYGITPVLQGYSGGVPNNFTQKHKDAKIVSQGGWVGFTRPDMLKTYVNEGEKDYFSEIADVFYQAQKDIFGDVTNYYAVDPFHEGGNMGDMNPAKVYNTVQTKMLEADKDAIWLLQEWSGGLTEEKMSGLVKKDQALVLDLFSEVSSYQGRMENQQVPWVWNMLHNFGGRMGIDGEIEKVSQNIPKDYANSKYMKGIGITPESLGNGPIMYDLLFDMAWTKDPIDFNEYVKSYAESRYGKANADLEKAWEILLDTGYSRKEGYYQGAPESVINARPTDNYTSASSWGHSNIQYDKEEFDKAVLLFANAYDEFKDNPAFMYDFVDITKQMLSNSAQEYHKLMINAYRNKDIAQFNVLSDKFLNLIRTQETILACSSDFQLGTWIDRSYNMIEGADDWTNDLFEFNARALVTTWGAYKAGSLKDYSNRQWAGLTGDFYLKRWEMFVDSYKQALTTNSSPKSIDYFMWEWQWANRKSDETYRYPSNATNTDLSVLARSAFEDYSFTNMQSFLDGEVSQAKKNIALGKTVTSNVESNADFPLSNLTDGDEDKGWKAKGATWPVELTVDLKEKKSVDGVAFALVPIAGDYPIQYSISVSEDGTSWKEVQPMSTGTVTGVVQAAYKGYAKKVKFTFQSGDPTLVPEFNELIVYEGKAPETGVENLASGIMPLVSDKWNTSLNITDGDLSTMWTADINGANDFDRNVHINLGEEKYVDEAEVYLDKAGLKFGIEIYYLDAKGTKHMLKDLADNKDPLPDMFKVPVHANIQKLYVHFTKVVTNTDGSYPRPALREVKILKYHNKQIKTENIAVKKPVTSSAAERPAANITDGNTKSLWVSDGGAIPAYATVDLLKPYQPEKAMLYFETAGRKFNFKVTAIDSAGKETIVLDKTTFTESEKTNGLAAFYEIPLKGEVQKLRVDFTGSVGTAWPAIAELEVYAKPDNISKDASVTSNIKDIDVAAIHDNDDTTFIELKQPGKKQFIYEFDQPYDVSAFELVKTGKEALHYTIEYQDGENRDDATWHMLNDQTMNEDSADFLIYELAQSIFARNVRITVLNDEITMHDVNVYRGDSSEKLYEYIEYVNKKIAPYAAGIYGGNIEQSTYDAMKAAVAHAKEAASQKPNKLEVEKEIDALTTKLKEFFMGYIRIDRDTILTNIYNAKFISTQLDGYKVLKETLDGAIKAARSVYDTHKVTQTQLDEASTTLQTNIDNALNAMKTLDRVESLVALADKKLKDTSVGEGVGNVSKEVYDALETVVKDAKKEYADMNEEDLSKLATKLDAAIKTFDEAMIRKDVRELIATIAEANTRIEKDFTKATWKTFETELRNAEDVVAAVDAQQKDIDKANTALKKAMVALIALDRSDLEKVILEAETYQENDYTAASWKIFYTAVQDAKKTFEKVSLEQTDVDRSEIALQDAIKQLVKADIPTPPVDEPINLYDKVSQVRLKGEPGVLDANTTLAVQVLSSSEAGKAITDAMAKLAKTFKVFDITLKNGDLTVQPYGVVEVTLPIDASFDITKVHLLSINDKGVYEEVVTNLDGKNRTITFKTKHLNRYVLYEAKEVGDSNQNTNQGENTSDATKLPWMLLLVSGMLVCIMRRKTKRNAQ